MSYLINPHRFGIASVYDDARVVYSTMRMFDSWTNAIFQVRRSSDSDLKYVFPDGSGLISLNSLTNTTATSPGATTLGTWVGANDGFVSIWISQNEDNSYNSADNLIGGNHPQIISSGSMISTNGVTDTDFLGSKSLAYVGQITEIDSGNDYTIYTVSNNYATSANAALLSTTNTNTQRLTVFNARGTNKRAGLINDGSDNYVFLDSQVNSDVSRLQTLEVDSSKNIRGYYNGTTLTANSYSSSYVNELFRLGYQLSNAQPLYGGIQCVIIFPSSATDRAAIEADLNNKFSIY